MTTTNTNTMPNDNFTALLLSIAERGTTQRSDLMKVCKVCLADAMNSKSVSRINEAERVLSVGTTKQAWQSLRNALKNFAGGYSYGVKNTRPVFIAEPKSSVLMFDSKEGWFINPALLNDKAAFALAVQRYEHIKTIDCDSLTFTTAPKLVTVSKADIIKRYNKTNAEIDTWNDIDRVFIKRVQELIAQAIKEDESKAVAGARNNGENNAHAETSAMANSAKMNGKPNAKQAAA